MVSFFDFDLLDTQEEELAQAPDDGIEAASVDPETARSACDASTGFAVASTAPPARPEVAVQAGGATSVQPERPAKVQALPTTHGLAEANAVYDVKEAGATGENVPSGLAPPSTTAQVSRQAPHEVDEFLWQRVAAEPSPATLASWVRSEPVRMILREFILEDVVCGAEVIAFRDVSKLLGAINLTPVKLASKFMQGDKTVDVERVTDSILRMFASRSGVAKDGAMCFGDLYRFFEASGITVRRLVSEFWDGCSPFVACDQPSACAGWRIANYIVRREIGSGFHGVSCYMGVHIVSGKRVAIKWPARSREVSIIRDLQSTCLGCTGFPNLLDWGVFEGSEYAVTEVLGSPFTKVFDRLRDHPVEKAWAAMKIIGRLVLRRLRVLHRCGYVHCDISPENILLGRSKGACAGQVAPYLIDFGLAQRHPGGLPLGNEQGSAEWSSIRSCDGGIRLPVDDLEALGWVLVHAVFGSLPWCDWLSSAYGSWDQFYTRQAVLQRVRDAKLRLLEEGWGAFGGRWAKLAEVPEDLDGYMRECRRASAAAGAGVEPDYAVFARLLGGGREKGTDTGLAQEEYEDLGEYQKRVVPLLS